MCASPISQPFQRLKCKSFQIGNCNKMINILFLHVTCFYLILLFQNCKSLRFPFPRVHCPSATIHSVSCVLCAVRAVNERFHLMAEFLHTNCQVPLPPWHCKPIKTTKLPDNGWFFSFFFHLCPFFFLLLVDGTIAPASFVIAWAPFQLNICIYDSISIAYLKH